MRTNVLLIALLPLVAACSEDMSAAERAERDAQTVERVRKANDQPPPLEQVVPSAILYPDIEQFDIYGEACSYAPGTSLGSRVIARESDAFMKIDGEVVRFAADPGSRALPARSRSLYNGRAYSLRLAIKPEETKDSATGETTATEGMVWLRDRWGRVVYQGTGTVRCGS